MGVSSKCGSSHTSPIVSVGVGLFQKCRLEGTSLYLYRLYILYSLTPLLFSKYWIGNKKSKNKYIENFILDDSGSGGRKDHLCIIYTRGVSSVCLYRENHTGCGSAGVWEWECGFDYRERRSSIDVFR